MKTGEVILHRARAEDAEKLGRICFEALKTISEAQGFPADFASVEAATGLMTVMMRLPTAFRGN